MRDLTVTITDADSMVLAEISVEGILASIRELDPEVTRDDITVEDIVDNVKDELEAISTHD